MQTTRIATIVEILLQEEKATAPDLSERLEVSRRTINRDIDFLIKAGIPVNTSQGIGGGIYLDKKKTISENHITTKPVQEILSVIREHDLENGTDNYHKLMALFNNDKSEVIYGSPAILFDTLSEEDSTVKKIKILTNAIEERQVVEFDYFAGKDQDKITVEPYYVVYRKANWYLWGIFSETEESKLFKISRIENIHVKREHHANKSVEISNIPREKEILEKTNIKAIFDSDMKNRLIEEKGINSFREMPDGKLLYEEEGVSDKNIIRWILTFGPKVEIIEPASMRERLKRISLNIANIYK